jgi:uncharacterized glyoxalase superfamily protein PhnB
MPAEPVRFDQLNLVASDFDATVAFYQRLGFEVQDHSGESDTIRHARIETEGQASLEFDNVALAQVYNAAWRSAEGSTRVVIGVRVASRDEVDRRYADLTDAGYEGRQPPFDAFWGSRYAIVADPDGNAVGIMSERDDDRRAWPPTQSPDTW